MTPVLLRYRIALGWVVTALVLYLAKPVAWSFALGLPVGLAGLAIRAAAAGVIRKGTELARRGPYRLTRNPLYFGSFLIAVGFGIMSAEVWAAGSLIAASLLVFPGMIRREEAVLTDRFGAEFERFRQEVPRFLPHRPSLALFDGFSAGRYIRNREYNAALGFVAATAALILKCYLGPS